MTNNTCYNRTAFFLFRLIVGLFFLLHGASKLGFNPKGEVAGHWFFLTTGVLEVAVGLLITLGLFTSIAAGIGAVMMTIAYFGAHQTNAVSNLFFGQAFAWSSINPLLNGGELALMFVGSFLVLSIFGSGSWSIDNRICKDDECCGSCDCCENDVEEHVQEKPKAKKAKKAK